MKHFALLLSILCVFSTFSCYPIEKPLTGPESGSANVTVQNQEFSGEAIYTSTELSETPFALIRISLEKDGVIEILDRQFQEGVFESDRFMIDGEFIAVLKVQKPSPRIYSAHKGKINIYEVTSEHIRGGFNFNMHDDLSSSVMNPEDYIAVSGEFYAIRE